MNDDLISRKDLLGTESLLMTDIVENDKVARCILEQVLHDIEHAPVAFDKEKVVEELDNLTGEECTLHECGIRSERCKACIAKKAIEIVEKGGVKHD